MPYLLASINKFFLAPKSLVWLAFVNVSCFLVNAVCAFVFKLFCAAFNVTGTAFKRVLYSLSFACASKVKPSTCAWLFVFNMFLVSFSLVSASGFSVATFGFLVT